MGAVQFGIAYDLLNADGALGDTYSDAVRTIRLAEALGFDSVWFGETHRRAAGHGHLPAPLVAAAGVATVTERLAIGTAVLLLPAYTPLEIAEQVAVLDQISKGRVILGVAPGLEIYRDFGWGNLPIPSRSLQSVMDEGIDVLRMLWDLDSVTVSGAHYRYEDAGCVPKPWQARLPILIGGITDRSIERAVLKGDGWIGGTPYPLPLIEAVRAKYVARAVQEGRQPGAFGLIRPIVIAPSDEEAERLAEEHVGQLIDYYIKRGAFIQEDRTAGDPSDQAVRAQAWSEIPIVGAPDTCVRKIEEYVQRCGVNHLLLRVRHPGLAEEEVRTMITLFAKEVLPRFHI